VTGGSSFRRSGDSGSRTTPKNRGVKLRLLDFATLGFFRGVLRKNEAQVPVPLPPPDPSILLAHLIAAASLLAEAVASRESLGLDHDARRRRR